MTKTREELKQLKEEYETLTIKLKELTEDELKIVTGGVNRDLDINVDESNIGTNEDSNILPPDIEPKNSL